MDYKTLQKEAKKLGINPVGVTKEELKKMIMELNIPIAGVSAADIKAVETVKEETVKEEYNTATVVNGNKEIRSYTLEANGENFKALAAEFANKKGYTVKLSTV